MSFGGCILIVSVTSCLTYAFNVSYYGYELMSVTPEDENQLKFVLELFGDHGQVDIWKHPGIGEFGLALVPPRTLNHIKNLLNSHNLTWAVANKDMDGLMKTIQPFAEEDPNYKGNRLNGEDILDHDKYHNLEAIETCLDKFEKKYPTTVKIMTLPIQTFEKRLIQIVKLAHRVRHPFNAKKSIIVEGSIHPREWISPASILYVIDKVLQQHTLKQEPGYSMLRDHDWYIVPVSNPDGYAHTTKDRYWRKNRRVSNRCIGVDVNRNFGYMFGTSGVNWNCHTSVYPGPFAFSEAESQTLDYLFDQVEASAVAYLSVHSFAQALLIPWFYSTNGEIPANYYNLRYVARKMTNAIKNTTGIQYKIGSVQKVFNYAASGSSADWFLSRKPGLFAMSIELRPDNDLVKHYGGFALDPSLIVPVGTDLCVALAMLAEGLKEFGL